MAGNSFGTLFKLTTFGESHGPAIGGIVDGCPAGITLDLVAVQKELQRRKPGQSAISTLRNEEDQVEFLSGIFEGQTTGTPIGFIIKNKDARSNDYDALKEVYRPGHADFTYSAKYGIRDHRGGGRSSARETACRVVAGAIAKQWLAQKGIQITAFVSQVHHVSMPLIDQPLSTDKIEASIVRCPNEAVALKMIEIIEKARDEGDSLGGVITCVCSGIQPGIGEPVFDKLNAVLAHAMFSINAVKGFEIGDGFATTLRKGSENNDSIRNGKETNHDGGIQGGISNGKDIFFRVAFKPTSTIAKAQETHNVHGEKVTLEAKGRHDPCVLPRAVPIVEAMSAMVLMDMILIQNSTQA